MWFYLDLPQVVVVCVRIDLDECAEGQNQCQQSCINTFGSFKCDCDVGYQPTPDQTSCTGVQMAVCTYTFWVSVYVIYHNEQSIFLSIFPDVDECLLPAAVTGCRFGCINTPGSFHCQCPAGYSQQTTDGHCQGGETCAKYYFEETSHFSDKWKRQCQMTSHRLPSFKFAGFHKYSFQIHAFVELILRRTCTTDLHTYRKRLIKFCFWWLFWFFFFLNGFIFFIYNNRYR